MTDDRSLERAARSWLEEGPTRAPDRPIEAALARIDTTRQERDHAIPWRLPSMFTNRLAFAAVAIVLIVAGGGFALSRMTGVGEVGSRAPSSPSSSASASPAPSLTITASDVGKALQPGRYRVNGFAAPFSVTLPSGWTVNELTLNSVGIAKATDATINVFIAVVDKIYPDPCHAAGGPRPIGAGVDALVEALSSMPDFQVIDIVDTTLGGATGKTFEFTNAVDVDEANCSGDMLPFATRTQDGDDIDIAVFGGETDQFWVVDAGGTTLLLAVTENKVPDVQPVLDSITFEDATSN